MWYRSTPDIKNVADILKRSGQACFWDSLSFLKEQIHDFDRTRCFYLLGEIEMQVCDVKMFIVGCRTFVSIGWLQYMVKQMPFVEQNEMLFYFTHS